MSDPRVIVLTGGTGGLGTAVVKRLAGRDYRFAVTYLVPEEARRFEKEVGVDEERLMLGRIDATNGSEIAGFFQQIVERFGAVHVVCSLVGGWAGGRDVEETDDVRFDRMIDVNLRSAFATVRAAVPHLKKTGWGRILLVGSRAAVEAPAGQAAFNVAKAGVAVLGMTVAQELEGTGVTANVIVPSVIDTPATRKALPFADYIDWPTPDEIAAVIDFILSDDSAVISGALIPVYGRT
ncbi:MAG: SDR family NAD(P)-dependent oxidoreductase [Acidimicrobiia bacterium]|nr:SDR family NAD(P)-dependent oxidoreductase [Acidimicrobiia bacterium]